jgi:hypothetical protein
MRRREERAGSRVMPETEEEVINAAVAQENVREGRRADRLNTLVQKANESKQHRADILAMLAKMQQSIEDRAARQELQHARQELQHARFMHYSALAKGDIGPALQVTQQCVVDAEAHVRELEAARVARNSLPPAPAPPPPARARAQSPARGRLSSRSPSPSPPPLRRLARPPSPPSFFRSRSASPQHGFSVASLLN